MRGRPPKPLALLKLEKGKLYDVQRAREDLEPQPTIEFKPRCPSRFSVAERKAWKGFAKALDSYGMLTAANAVSLELVSEAWAKHLECGRQMAEAGTFFIRGKPCEQFKAQMELAKLIMTLLRELGLSSLSMARLGSIVASRQKAKDKFFDD